MWEYKTLKIYVDKKFLHGKVLDLRNMESELNRLGAEGWELLSVLDTTSLASRNKYYLAFLKRRTS